MNHPTLPLPEHLKPAVKQVLQALRDKLASAGHNPDCPAFICLLVSPADIEIRFKQELRAFISASLQGNHTMAGWPSENGCDYDLDSAEWSSQQSNVARLEWLTWLTA